MSRNFISLRQLIILVAITAILLVSLSNLYSSYKMDKQMLIESSLETNRVYAEKLAKITDESLADSLRVLNYSAGHVAQYMSGSESDLDTLKLEAERLRNQYSFFNSVVITNSAGDVLTANPNLLNIKKDLIDSECGQRALVGEKPFISTPYTCSLNQLLIFLSTPIFDYNGTYLGLIGGSIYLKEDNVLKQLLGEHFYKDGSYVYVVDQSGNIIFHKDRDRITDNAANNDIVQRLMAGESGAERVINTLGIDMLAGYAIIPSTGWGVVSQRPTEQALLPAKDLIIEMMLKSIPFIVLAIFIAGLFARKVAQPLNSLAFYAEKSRHDIQKEEIENINVFYYEATQLKKVLAQSISFFHDRIDSLEYESTTDPLTKLVNRRTLESEVHKLLTSNKLFSLIMLDIDRFKKVNDTYGHAVGDEVLQYLAKLMEHHAREHDICCRYGGEEFIVLLPETNKDEAYTLAEQFRQDLATTISPTGKRITVSLGIATYPDDATNYDMLVKKADECLYQAKNQGRNKTVAS